MLSKQRKAVHNMGSIGQHTSIGGSFNNQEVVAYLRTEKAGYSWLDYAKVDANGYSTLYKDLGGYLGYELFNTKLIPFKNIKKPGVEYGIAGFKRQGNDGGYSGYKIENDTLYVTKFSPTTKAKANKWAREDVNKDGAWTPLGKVKKQ